MGRTLKAMGSRSNHKQEGKLTEDAVAQSMDTMDDVAAFMAKDQRNITMVSALDIHKTYNARYVPCTFAEFAKIDWPAYETPAGDLEKALEDCLTDAAWFNALDNAEKTEFIDFMSIIHFDSKNISETVQLLPIILERDGLNGEPKLVDGERRVLCSLYSLNKKNGQRIHRLKALISNELLGPLRRAVSKEWANKSLKLKPHEQLEGWGHIFDAYKEEHGKKPSAREFASLAGTNRDQAGYTVKLLTHSNRDDLFVQIRKGRLGWRDIKDLLRLSEDEGVSKSSKEKARTPKQPSKKNISKPDTEHSTFLNSVRNKFGQTSKVKITKAAVTLTVPREKLKELESLLDE